MVIYQALHGGSHCTMLSSLFCYTERSYHEDPSSGLRVMLTVRSSNYFVFLNLWTMGQTRSLTPSKKKTFVLSQCSEITTIWVDTSSWVLSGNYLSGSFWDPAAVLAQAFTEQQSVSSVTCEPISLRNGAHRRDIDLHPAQMPRRTSPWVPAHRGFSSSRRSSLRDWQ